MTILDSELDMQSSVAVVYLLRIVIKKSVVDFILLYTLALKIFIGAVSSISSDRRLPVVF